jgi:hypothetical protein
MPYHETVTTLAEDAGKLEEVYQAAVRAGEGDAFKAAIDLYQADPSPILGVWVTCISRKQSELFCITMS